MSDEEENKASVGRGNSPDALEQRAEEVINDILSALATTEDGSSLKRAPSITTVSGLLAIAVVFFYVFGDEFGAPRWLREVSLLLIAVLLIAGPIIDRVRRARRTTRVIQARFRVLREQLPKDDAQKVITMLANWTSREGKS